jgi:hypothetical protein
MISNPESRIGSLLSLFQLPVVDHADSFFYDDNSNPYPNSNSDFNPNSNPNSNPNPNESADSNNINNNSNGTNNEKTLKECKRQSLMDSLCQLAVESCSLVDPSVSEVTVLNRVIVLTLTLTLTLHSTL